MTYGDSIKNLQIQWELKSRIYEKMKDFETAYTYQLNSALMRDSLFQARNNELLANYNARFNNQNLNWRKATDAPKYGNAPQPTARPGKDDAAGKEQTRIELENRNLQLEQQQTAIELEKPKRKTTLGSHTQTRTAATHQNGARDQSAQDLGGVLHLDTYFRLLQHICFYTPAACQAFKDRKRRC